MSDTFTSLEHFIRHEMRMSHIYQPVMLLELLTSKGSASVNQIAKALLSHDASQIEYYEQITKNMVGKVLTKNRQITYHYRGNAEGSTLRLTLGTLLASDSDFPLRRVGSGRRMPARSAGRASPTSRHLRARRSALACGCAALNSTHSNLPDRRGA